MQALARAGLRNPVRINVAVAGAPRTADGGADAGGGQKTPSELSIRYLVCDMEQKLPYLVRFLQVKLSCIWYIRSLSSPVCRKREQTCPRDAMRRV